MIHSELQSKASEAFITKINYTVARCIHFMVVLLNFCSNLFLHVFTGFFVFLTDFLLKMNHK